MAAASVRRAGVLLVAAALLAAGCSRGPRSYPVSGTITLDGKPLDDGNIYFLPLDPNVSADAGKIQAGAFRFEAREGTMRVEIRASREVPGKRSPMGNIRKEEYIPARYNRESTLEAEVRANGENVYSFELTSGKK
jgi:hypothetical protein